MKVYKTMVYSTYKRCALLDEQGIPYTTHKDHFVFFKKEERERALEAMALSEGCTNQRWWLVKVLAKSFFEMVEYAGDNVFSAVTGGSNRGLVHLLWILFLVLYGHRSAPGIPVWEIITASGLDYLCVLSGGLLLSAILRGAILCAIPFSLVCGIPWVVEWLLNTNANWLSNAVTVIPVKATDCLCCIYFTVIVVFTLLEGLIEMIVYFVTAPKDMKT